MDDNPLDLRRVWAVLWSKAPLIIVIVLVFAGAAFLYGSLQKDVYRTTAKIRVANPSSQSIFGQSDGGGEASEVPAQLELLESADLREDIERQLGDSSAEIRSVSFAQVGTTDFINISVTSTSPDVAQQAADAYAQTFLAQRQDRLTQNLSSSANELRTAAANLDAQIAGIDLQLLDPGLSAAEGDVLRTQRLSLVGQQADLRERATQFEIEATSRTGSLELVQVARVPTSPFSPTPARDALVAGVIGLVLAIGLVFLLDKLDDRVHSALDVEQVGAPIPVLGAIPIHSDKKKGARKLPKSSDRALVPLQSISAEAYRTLRTSLRFSSIGTRRKTIVVTSSDQAEGKSTVVANLAVTLAESGLRVVVVSADLRRPTISHIFDVDDLSRGLTTVLLGDAQLTDCLQRVPLPSGHGLYLLPSGPLPQNPAELLGSQAMRDVIAAIEKAGADYLLIDSPPVLPVSDALSLAQFADGVLVLTLANRTRKSHLAETLDRLDRVNADVVGTVINGIPTRGRYYGGYYGYGAYGGYAQRSDYHGDTAGDAESGTRKRRRKGKVVPAEPGPLAHSMAGDNPSGPARSTSEMSSSGADETVAPSNGTGAPSLDQASSPTNANGRGVSSADLPEL